MRLKTTDIVLDSKTYPRKSISRKTVETYANALALDAQFPPIEVQAVINYPDHAGPVWLVIDGAHRLTAYIEVKLAEIEVVTWQQDPLDYEAEWQSIKLEAAERNISHGDRLSEGDKKETARSIADSNPDIKWTEEMMAKKLGVAQPTINSWIKDIRARQRASRESVIIRLSRLGWTQETIADAVKLERSSVAKIVKNISADIFHNFLAQGKTVDEIVKILSVDYALVWAYLLDEKDDHARFQELNWGLRTWDLWNFNDCDPRFGDDWPGRIPGQLVAHTLYYFTEPGQRVLDPMAGGGVAPDVCLAFNRRCYAYDLATRKNRPEIMNHYWPLGSMVWPEAKKPDLIFFDPPYFTKMEEEYEDKATAETPPTSSLDKKAYLEFFREFFSLAHANTAKGARLAFLNADWRDFESTTALEENESNAITIFDYYRLLSEAGWSVTHRIECPLSSQRMNGNTVKHMQNGRILGTVNRTLLVAKR